MPAGNLKYCNPNVICPYYRFDISRQSFVCEGFGTFTLRVCFKNRNDMIDWASRVCCTYVYAERCPIAGKLNEKYKEE